MIATLTGKIESVGGENCILDVGGVGFQVFMPLSALETLSRETGPVKLYTHFHLREEGVSLYGFLSPDDRLLFEKIIGVSGIGPKTALAILGTFSGDDFREAVRNEDYGALTRVSGVGLKTAQRLILELKDKLGKGIPSGAGGVKLSGYRSPVTDAVDALVALGYSSKEATAVVETISAADRNLTTPEIVRQALRSLAKK